MSGQAFLLPDLGEGLTEAEVVRWLVAAGDVVAVDQGIVEVETAKSVVELPSPYAGRVEVLHAAEGETLAVGQPLFTVVAAAAETYREEERAGSGNVLIGYGTTGATTTARRRRPRSGIAPARTHSGSAPLASSASAPLASSASVPRVISPLVRMRAREGGLDLAGIPATGPGGVITRADVERALAAPPPRADPRPAAGSQPGAGRPSVSGERRIPLSGFRKAVSAALTRSRSEIPEATVWVDVDATKLWELRESTRPGPGLIAYIARFVVAGLREYPVLNARLDTERQEIVELDQINLGIAVQGERGLVVPAVPGAEALTTAQLDQEIRRVTAAARAGRPPEPTAGTFTLNNYGSFGVDGSAAIINHPQVAILGVGRVIDRPWVVAGELCVRKVAQLSFVFDHRVCDGGTAAGFLRGVADAIEEPASVIARL